MIEVATAGNVKFVPVVLGNDINAYGVVRSFYAEYGVKSIILCKSELAFCNPCNHSKLIQRTIIDDKVTNDKVFLEQLGRIKKEVGKDVEILLIPCADNYSELISKNQADLKKHFKFATIKFDLFKKLINKETFYQQSEKFGLPYPKTALINENNYEHCDELGFPIIIKPANPVKYAQTRFIGVKKIYLANSMEEVKAIVKEVYASIYDEDLIVQEYLAGDDDLEAEIHAYSDQSGKVTFMQFNKVVLELPTPGGLGSYGTTITSSNDKVLKQAKTFLEKINYTGFSNFDLKLDTRDNTYKFFEINLRLSRSSFSMTAAGYNFAKMIVEDLLLNKKRKLTISDKEILYSIIPFKTAIQYCNDTKLISQMQKLNNAGKLHGSFWDNADNSILRRLTFWRDQNTWHRNFNKYFNTRRNV